MDYVGAPADLAAGIGLIAVGISLILLILAAFWHSRGIRNLITALEIQSKRISLQGARIEEMRRNQNAVNVEVADFIQATNLQIAKHAAPADLADWEKALMAGAVNLSISDPTGETRNEHYVGDGCPGGHEGTAEAFGLSEGDTGPAGTRHG